MKIVASNRGAGPRDIGFAVPELGDGFLFFSGQVAQDPATGKVVEGGIVPETERVFQNPSAVLKAASKSFDDVVRAGVFRMCCAAPGSSGRDDG